ncbi:MAG: methyltransferase [Polyangiaceae bacterium]|nr:methyltransferase [Polyangiaceae bacterium]
MRVSDERLADPAFAPPRRLVPELVAELAEADDDRARLLVKALARVPLSTLPAVTAALPGERRARPRLVELLGRVAAHVAVDVDALGALLRDEDAKTRKAAVRALVRVEGEAATRRLADALDDAADVHLRRALVDALGRRGDAVAREALARVEATDDTAERAKARAARDQLREQETQVSLDAPLPAGTVLALDVRAGLEPLLIEELDGRGARASESGRVSLRWEGALRPLFAARTFTSVAVWPPVVPLRADRARAVASALTSKAATAAMQAITEGPLRYRLSLDPAGPRAELEQIASLVAARDPRLVNDPRDAAWQVDAVTSGQSVRVALRPRALVDPRFAYRRADVPASSHPTIAAALARLAGARDDDVVWDPFVGSGLELAERALLGPARRMVGTDRDPRALAAARRNLAAVGARCELVHDDARSHRVPGLSLVLTNPPMGRRTGDAAALRALLDDVLTRAAEQLIPGGRLVWVSPMAGTRHLAAKLGLRERARFALDMGGFTAEVQQFAKPR